MVYGFGQDVAGLRVVGSQNNLLFLQLGVFGHTNYIRKEVAVEVWILLVWNLRTRVEINNAVKGEVEELHIACS